MCNKSIKRCTAMISIASVGGETGECDEGVSRGSFKVLVVFDFTGQIVATQLLIILLFKLLSMAEISHFFLVKIKD